VTRLERCPETHDAKCAATEPCEEECMLDGINWHPGMPNRGRRPRSLGPWIPQRPPPAQHLTRVHSAAWRDRIGDQVTRRVDRKILG
jgi:hypothetical protein